MKRFLVLFLCLSLGLPCSAEIILSNNIIKEDGTMVFIYHIPDEETTENKKEILGSDVSELFNIVSDDITADTSPKSLSQKDEDVENIQLSLQNDSNYGDYLLDDMYSDVLRGYAVYEENENDIITLEDTLCEYHTIKINNPYKIRSTKLNFDKVVHNNANRYSKLTNSEYSIAPISNRNIGRKGAFSAGTLFDQEIDYAEIESSSGIFSRYDSKYFALSTAYAKTVNSTNNNYNDNFYIAPELKLGQYFTLKEVFSADITKNRKKAEIILSIRPFGKTDSERLKFELGANATYDDNNALLKNQLKFSTKFQL